MRAGRQDVHDPARGGRSTPRISCRLGNRRGEHRKVNMKENAMFL